MAGLASLFAALLIALALQRRIWDEPPSDEPLSVQLSLLVLLVALPLSICIVAITAVDGETELSTTWEKIVVALSLSWSLLWLVTPSLVPRVHLLGETLATHVPDRLSNPARVFWHLLPLIIPIGVAIPLMLFSE